MAIGSTEQELYDRAESSLSELVEMARRAGLKEREDGLLTAAQILADAYQRREPDASWLTEEENPAEELI